MDLCVILQCHLYRHTIAFIIIVIEHATGCEQKRKIKRITVTIAITVALLFIAIAVIIIISIS